jgi:CHAT domain-containing protein/tetratricopeptide (TPR) repeat protein
MKTIILFFFSLFSGMLAFSQNVDKAMEYYNIEKYDSAAMEFELALPIIEQKYGAKDTSFYTKKLFYAAESFEKSVQYEKAELCYIKIKLIYEALNSIKDQEYINSIHNLAKLYYLNGSYNKAEPLYEQAMELTKTQHGEDNPAYPLLLNDYGSLCYQMGHYDNAESLFKKTLEIDKIKFGENHPEYLKCLSNLALTYSAMGNYDTAELLSKQVIDIAKVQLGENNIGYATYINNLAIIYHDIGHYKEAEPLFMQALEIARTKLGENHPDFTLYLNNLAEIYFQLGRLEIAEPLYKQVLEIDKKLLGENHPYYINDLSNLAAIYQSMGLFEQAEPLSLKAVKIVQQQFGENNSQYAIYLNNLAQLYKAMGRYEIAEPLMKQALEIDKAQLGEDHPNYAIKVATLASLYDAMGRYEQAEILKKQALDIQKAKFGENHPNYAKYLNGLAGLYYSMGRFDEVEPLLRKAIEIVTIQFGENFPDNALYFNSLGMLYVIKGYYNRADTLITHALKIAKEQSGINQPEYVIYLNNLAKLKYLTGCLNETEILYNEAFQIYQNQIKTNTGFLSERELKQYLNSFLYHFELYQSLNCQLIKNHSPIGGFAFDIELYRKGILLKSAVEVKTHIMKSGDTALINTYFDLRALHKKINKLYASSPDKRKEDPVKLEEQSNELEKMLTLKSKDFQKAKIENEVTWKNIQQNLKPDEATIEFTNFHFYNGNKSTDSILYCAILLRSEDTIPHMVYLCNESQLKKAIPSPIAGFNAINTAYGQKQDSEIPDKSRNIDMELFNLVWKPIDNLLTGVNTVYFAPSGLLNKVSMAAILCPSNKFLMDKYKLIQLSSTRILAVPQESVTINNAVVYGGIKYDTDTTALLTQARKYNKKEGPLLAYNRSATGNLRNGFMYLPGTKKEADLIAAKLEKKRIPTTSYSGTDASEESFAALSGNNSPSIIHLSTHGFYYPDTISDENRKKMDLSGSGDVKFRYSDDPLLRSGLLLSGANLAWKGLPRPEGLEDGILTAKEVSNMNLMNTQLVVLSACQTGQGDVKGSEGVEGLQRGFKMAGVRNIIMSLWDVPDKETTEFMADFYDNWLGGKDIHEAFRETQITMKNKYKNEPAKWAAFVLVE